MSATSEASGRVAGKVALVTGAGSGIGRAVAVRLAEEGADVIVTSRTPANLRATADLVERVHPRRPMTAAVDVTDDRQIRSAVNAVVQRFGRIDIVSHNAGIELPSAPAVVETTDGDWQHLLDVNLTGAFRVSRAAIPTMADDGAIVFMASMNSFVTWPNNAAYSASKGGLLQFTRALAVELASRRIRVNCVCPGIIDTPLTTMFLEQADDAEAVLEDYRAVSPLRRLGDAREVAHCVLFLASTEASFVTGAAFVVDGGSTLCPQSHT
jgi:NAD(P)-dependent dehydrogenase (short-subunit alcohol dehydrogenase family)